MPARAGEDCVCAAALVDAGMTWTEERIELLAKLWSEGLSASQIAAELGGGMSRNAVLGKAHRLGLVRDETKSLFEWACVADAYLIPQ